MQKPIGIFDSGVGGLTVLKSLMTQFPSENFVYLGDTARVPYGTKGEATINKYSKECVEFLISEGVKLVVVACNTSSAVALPTLASLYRVPIIGVVKPAAREAVKKTKNHRIGIIGTKRTVESHAYDNEIKYILPASKVYSAHCPLFVPLVEEGWTNNEVAQLAAKIYLNTLKKNSIDTLILGCTHYPLLKDIIKKVIGSHVTLIESGQATAEDVDQILTRIGHNPQAKSKRTIKFYVTDDTERFDRFTKIFLKTYFKKSVRAYI